MTWVNQGKSNSSYNTPTKASSNYAYFGKDAGITTPETWASMTTTWSAETRTWETANTTTQSAPTYVYPNKN